LDKNGQLKTGPINELYNLLKILPLEIVFTEDGTAKSISTKTQGDVSEMIFNVYKNQEGDATKYLLRVDSDHDEDMIMTLRILTKDKLEASFETVSDDMTMDLKMDKVK
jgi:hypothetical protein